MNQVSELVLVVPVLPPVWADMPKLGQAAARTRFHHIAEHLNHLAVSILVGYLHTVRSVGPESLTRCIGDFGYQNKGVRTPLLAKAE